MLQLYNNKFDLLSLYVKRNKKDEILQYYQCFNWKLKEENANKMYVDIVDLVLIRPHTLCNKDNLQLLQVYMEESLNKKAKLEQKKYPRSTSCGFVGMFIVLVSLVFSLVFKLNLLNVVGQVLFMLCVLLGVVAIVVVIVVVSKKKKA